MSTESSLLYLFIYLFFKISSNWHIRLLFFLNFGDGGGGRSGGEGGTT